MGVIAELRYAIRVVSFMFELLLIIERGGVDEFAHPLLVRVSCKLFQESDRQAPFVGPTTDRRGVLSEFCVFHRQHEDAGRTTQRLRIFAANPDNQPKLPPPAA